MKKKISVILFVLAVITFVCSIAFSVYGLIDINNILVNLEDPSGKTALSYFGIGWAMGVGLFTISSGGLVLSIISTKLNENIKLKLISYLLIILFVLLLVFAIIVFFI